MKYLPTNYLQNNTLSLISSELHSIVDGNNASHEDIAMWHAPSECYDDANRYASKALAEVFEKYDISYQDWSDELDSRLSSKWIYNSLLGQVGSYLHPCG